MQPKFTTPLNTDYKPIPLLVRDKQLHEMIDLEQGNWANNLFLQGVPGSGKTLTAKIFADEIHNRSRADVYYMECEPSLSLSFENMKHEYSLDIPKYDLAPASIAREIAHKTPENKWIGMVIDEPQNTYHSKDVDAMLFSYYENFLRSKKTFFFILISQMRYLRLNQTFTPATLSRMQFKPLMFAPYNAEETAQILKQRLDVMFDSQPYELNAIAQLCAHIRRIGGDMREALDILRYAIEHADTRIDTKTMEESIEWGKNRWWRKELNALPPHYSFLLYLSAQTAKNNGGVGNQPYAINRYLKAAKDYGFTPIGNRTIYYVFQILAEKGYFQPELEGFGKRRITKLKFEIGDRDRILHVGDEIDWSLELIDTATVGKERAEMPLLSTVDSGKAGFENIERLGKYMEKKP